MIQIDENFDIDKLSEEEVVEAINELEKNLNKHIILFVSVIALLAIGTLLMTLKYLPFNWVSIVIMILCIYDINRNLRLGRLVNAQLSLFKIILAFKNFKKD